MSEVISSANVQRLRPFRTLEGHTANVKNMAFSPDGQMLASGSEDSTIRLWRLADGRSLSTLTGHTDMIASVAISADGTVLASASEDATIRIWQLPEGTHLRTLRHELGVESVAISADGQNLASSSNDGTVRVWRLADGKELRRVGHDYNKDFGSMVAFVPYDPSCIAEAGGKQVIFWQISQSKRIQVLEQPGPVGSLAFAPDGQILAVAASKQVLLWDTQTGQCVSSLRHKSFVEQVAFTPDRQILISSSSDGQVHLWQVPEPEVISPPNMLGILRWRIAQLRHREIWSTPEDLYYVSLAISPDGRSLVLSGLDDNDDNKIQLWGIE